MQTITPVPIIEQYFNTDISAIGRADQIDILTNLLDKLIRDLGKKLTDSDTLYIVTSLVQTLNRRYRMWRISDLVGAFENGKIGNYGSSYSINVATLESWLYKHHNDEVNPRIVREQIKTQADKHRATCSMMEGMVNNHSDRADVLLWRLKVTDALKPTLNRVSVLPKSYYEQKQKLWSIPPDEVSAALRANTTAALLDKYGLRTS
ncbi:MAG: hypothetical protein JXR39_11450 [Marinilabiliaceae bacterium]|nr:hypothetical protein [Marinilabiliaceae bacterium]